VLSPRRDLRQPDRGWDWPEQRNIINISSGAAARAVAWAAGVLDHDEGGRTMTIFRWLMAPANAMCDALGVADEHERGMIRMLVNSLIWITIGAIGFFVAWMKLTH